MRCLHSREPTGFLSPNILALSDFGMRLNKTLRKCTGLGARPFTYKAMSKPIDSIQPASTLSLASTTKPVTWFLSLVPPCALSARLCNHQSIQSPSRTIRVPTMHLSILSLSVGGALVAAAGDLFVGESNSFMAINGLFERQIQCVRVPPPLTCERSCGPGYVTCSFLPHCYNPGLGQVCCSNGSQYSITVAPEHPSLDNVDD